MSDSASSTNKKPLKIDERELDRLQQELIRSDLVTPDRLYVDLALFKDFNIGVLASFHAQSKSHLTPEDYKARFDAMIDALPAYQERYFNDMPHYFPMFLSSQTQFDDRIRDPEWASYILHHSPVTPYLLTIKSQILIIENHSVVAGKRAPISMTVNTWPLKLNKQDQFVVGHYFAQFLELNVEVICKDPSHWTYEDAVGYDEIYTCYFKEYLDVDRVREGYETLKFVRKRLFASRLFGVMYDPKIDVEKDEKLIRMQMDALTIFQFVHPRLCSSIPPNTLSDTSAQP